MTARPTRLLVTGAAGFIGTNFVRHALAAGVDRLVALDLLTYAGNYANLADLEGDPRFRFVRLDVAAGADVARLVADERIEAIVHCAAETHVDRSIGDHTPFLRTNVDGTIALLEAARGQPGFRCFLHVSTDEVYGSIAEGRAREDWPTRPSSPYSASKAGGDLQVIAAVRTHGADACVTRGGNTYGPNQYPEKMIPLFVTNALDGEPLPVYGDGRQRRVWVHVEDHCAAVEFVLREGAAGEAYNIGGEEQENLVVTERILELTDASPDLVRYVDDRPGHDRRYSPNDAKLRALGWSPQRTFDAGLAATVGWYRDNRAWWEPIKSGEYRSYYEHQYANRLR